jgi:hypothetical protein
VRVKVIASLWPVALSNEVFMRFLVANPEPQESVGPFNSESAVAQRDSRGPDFLTLPVADFLELQ